MPFHEIASFVVVHGQRTWPWVSFDAARELVAFQSGDASIATRRREGERVVEGPSFAVPADLRMTSFAISSNEVAIAGVAHDRQVVAVIDASGERQRIELDAALGEGHEARAIAFDRTGGRFWVSAESATETVIALFTTSTLETVGVLRSPAFPRPAVHELHLHPQDDAVLLLAACGDDGTFARVVGYAGDEVSAITGPLDNGALAAGFVGFSEDGARVHLVEADELRTHAWPTLHELSSVPLVDDFVANYAGAVLGGEILVEGQDSETGEDAVVAFDRSALRGVLLPPPAPEGMWAGRLGRDAIVTIEPKGDPARARVLLRSGKRSVGLLS